MLNTVSIFRSHNISKRLFIIPFLCGVLLIATWELLIQRNIIPEFILPAPSTIIQVLISDFYLIYPHMLQTLLVTISGIIISVIIAFIGAIAIDISIYIKNIIYPIILLFQIVPIIIFTPMIIIWLGYGISTQLITVILMVFFPMLMTLNNGFSSVSVEHSNLLHSMKATIVQKYLWVKIPNAIPYLFAGIKMSITYGVTASVISEWIGAIQGLGVIMIRSQKSFLISRVFAITLIIVLISVVLYFIVLLIEKKILPWKKFIHA